MGSGVTYNVLICKEADAVVVTSCVLIQSDAGKVVVTSRSDSTVEPAWVVVSVSMMRVVPSTVEMIVVL